MQMIPAIAFLAATLVGVTSAGSCPSGNAKLNCNRQQCFDWQCSPCSGNNCAGVVLCDEDGGNCPDIQLTGGGIISAGKTCVRDGNSPYNFKVCDTVVSAQTCTWTTPTAPLDYKTIGTTDIEIGPAVEDATINLQCKESGHRLLILSAMYFVTGCSSDHAAHKSNDQCGKGNAVCPATLKADYQNFPSHNWGTNGRSSIQIADTIQQKCNSNSCSIYVSNSMNGDPCVGCMKALTIRARCVPSSNPCDQGNEGHKCCEWVNHQFVPRSGPNVHMCRAACGVCDKEEYCSGVSPICPTDVYQPDTFICEDTTEEHTCQKPWTCTGGKPGDVLPSTSVYYESSTQRKSSPKCPSTISYKTPVRAAGTLCRKSASVCDKPDYCDGTSSVCQDSFYSPGTVCRATSGTAVDLCDIIETCQPKTAAGAKAGETECQQDGNRGVGTVCEVSSGPCGTDKTCQMEGGKLTCLPEKENGQPKSLVGKICNTKISQCDGVEKTCESGNPQCPTSGPQAQGTYCKPPLGLCDVPKTCSGSSVVCPTSASRDNIEDRVCRPARGSCDLPETCTQSSMDCPKNSRWGEDHICLEKSEYSTLLGYETGECEVDAKCDGGDLCFIPDYCTSNSNSQASVILMENDDDNETTAGRPRVSVESILRNKTLTLFDVHRNADAERNAVRGRTVRQHSSRRTGARRRHDESK